MSGKKVVVVHQPDFIPYLGFFHRLMHADVWIVQEHVQLNERGWVHRDKIKTEKGCEWLTIPLQKTSYCASIDNRLISEAQNWRARHLNRLSSAYRKAPFFHEIWPAVEDVYANRSSNLSAFTLHSIEVLMNLLQIRVLECYGSRALNPQFQSNELVAELVSKVDGTHYLSGVGARDYHDNAPYQAAGIEVLWQDFTHPVYPQLHGEFVPYLTTFDALFNCGVEGTRKLLGKS